MTETHLLRSKKYDVITQTKNCTLGKPMCAPHSVIGFQDSTKNKFSVLLNKSLDFGKTC